MSTPPKKFINKNGVLTLNPDYMTWKKKNGGNIPQQQQHQQTHFEAPIDKMNIQIQVIQGTGLVAKDRNLLGKKTTSDPYVVVSLLSSRGQKLEIGRTKTIYKNLSPSWDCTLTAAIPYLQYGPSAGNTILLFQIFDEDQMSAPDSMGVIKIPLVWNDARPSGPTWHDVPKDSAKNASGKIQLKISSKIHRMENVRPYV
jgi:Ca2+-dependent lipid-binding protein